MEATIGTGTHGEPGVPDAFEHPRGLFCNRTLNLRKIQAVGYDMDYTLVHYHVALWEERAYSYIKTGLQAQGWPVADLVFDPDLVVQGLVVDTEKGNVVKANRFGYVKRAYHGTEPLGYADQRAAYRRTLVDLHDRRWRFMNTLFSISEAGIYLQLVDKLDAGELPGRMGYDDLYDAVRRALDAAHLEGLLKAEILADPDRFVDRDPDVPLALLDQKEAGKKVLLITNSEWEYAAPILRYAFDPFLPGDMTWRDLFDLAIVGARKPAFFDEQSPASSRSSARTTLGGPSCAATPACWRRGASTSAATRPWWRPAWGSPAASSSTSATTSSPTSTGPRASCAGGRRSCSGPWRTRSRPWTPGAASRSGSPS